MTRKMKLEKYSELGMFPNVAQVSEKSISPLELSERWDPSRPCADMPLVIEVGCGTAEHTLGMAADDPDRFFIGIDLKGGRLWQGARRALDSGLTNAFFIRIRAEYLADYFPPASISEIWITFPDPHIKRSLKSAEKRLTSPGFIDMYRRILEPGGAVHLKTDNEFFYDYSTKSIERSGGIILSASGDIHAEGADGAIHRTTAYERRFIREKKKIMYIKFGF